jgi:hypothetical protein
VEEPIVNLLQVAVFIASLKVFMPIVIFLPRAVADQIAKKLGIVETCPVIIPFMSLKDPNIQLPHFPAPAKWEIELKTGLFQKLPREYILMTIEQ